MADAERSVAEPWFETVFARCYTDGGSMDGFLCGELAARPGLVASRDDVQPLDYGALGSIVPSDKPLLLCDLNLPDHHAAYFSPNVVVIDHQRPPPDDRIALCLHRQGICAAAILWNATSPIRDRIHGCYTVFASLDTLVHAVGVGHLGAKEEALAYAMSQRYAYLLEELGWQRLWKLFSIWGAAMYTLPTLFEEILDALIESAEAKDVAQPATETDGDAVFRVLAEIRKNKETP